RFVSILRESPDEMMTVEGGPDACRVVGATNEFEMPGEDVTAFPDIPTFDQEIYHEISAGVLREMIRRTVFAAATGEQLRYGATTGILWELDGNEATLIATDGRRLAMMKGLAEPHGEHTTKGTMPV